MQVKNNKIEQLEPLNLDIPRIILTSKREVDSEWILETKKKQCTSKKHQFKRTSISSQTLPC